MPLLNGPTEFTSRCPVPVQFTTKGKKFAENGDILFCVRGSTTGRMNYADQKFVIGRGIAAIRGKNGYPTQYVRAVIERSLDRLLAAATGSTFPNIGRDQLLNFEVETVSPEDAIEVNKLIVSLEDKVEINRQINQTLEQIAQTIFKSWFVDFEPVKAKIEAKAAGRDPERAAMCAISGKLEPELDQFSPEQHQQLAATAALFPDVLVDSELGLIPVGWEVQRIKDVVKRHSVGEKYSQKTASETGIVPILDQGKSGVIGYHSNKPGVKASPDDPIIVFANHTCYMRLIMHDFSAIQNVLPFKGVAQNIYWLYAATIGKQEFIEYKGHWPDFEIKELVIPTRKLDQIYGDFVSGLFREIFANDCQTALLADIRDTLLPKLLSGELSVGSQEVASAMETAG